MSDPVPLGAEAAYRLWAGTYEKSGQNPLADAVERAVWRILPDVAGLAVLDVGCGLGRWSALLAARGARPVGVDFVEAMLRAAARPFARAVADMHRLPFEGAFDGAICSLVLSHVADLGQPLAQIAGALRAGAWVVVADIHPDAAARGWRRTFTDAAGRRHEVAWTPHTAAGLHAAMNAAGLRIDAAVDESLEAATLPPRLRHAADGPAAYAVRARKG